MCVTPTLLPPGVRPLYGRLAWLDSIRFVAIAVMVLDHAMLCFAPGNAISGVLRMTLTRCAEPLFVFVLTCLTIYLRRPLSKTRWWQIVVVSVVTSTALSIVIGHIVTDVLASIALATLLLKALLRMNRRACLWALYGAAIVAVFPFSVGGIAFDYSPALIVYQMLLARLHCERGFRVPVTHGVASATLMLMVALGCHQVGAGLSPGVFTVIFGHPLAALVIRSAQSQQEHYSTAVTRLASRPLAVYATHLIAFAATARWMGLV